MTQNQVKAVKPPTNISPVTILDEYFQQNTFQTRFPFSKTQNTFLKPIFRFQKPQIHSSKPFSVLRNPKHVSKTHFPFSETPNAFFKTVLTSFFTENAFQKPFSVKKEPKKDFFTEGIIIKMILHALVIREAYKKKNGGDNSNGETPTT